MLYLDPSALVKKYVGESGSPAVARRLAASEIVFTSVLSFAEIHAVLGRKLREGELNEADLREARGRFEADWQHSLRLLELNPGTLAILPDLVVKHPLKGADAVHVASALWLRNFSTFGAPEFWAADKSLLRVAAACGLPVVNPETV